MSKEFATEKEVKNALNIRSFKHLPVEKHEDLAKLLLNTRKDVAVGIINQLPQYATYMSGTLSQLTNVCQTILSEGKKSHQDTIRGYMLILENLEIELHKKHLTARRKTKITNQMLEIADKIAKEGEKHKTFVLSCFKTIGSFGVVLGSLALTVFAIAKTTIKK